MRPNILWIVTTQWRGQATGLEGDPNARTPGLEALAAAGAVFPQAVTPHPFGPFARAALLTGVPSPANGVRDYFDPLPPQARTVAHELRDRGYTTAHFGSWHLGPRPREAEIVGEAAARAVVPAGHRGGFDLWEGFGGGFQLNDPWLHGTRLPEPVRFEGYQADVVCGRAAALLGTLASPWFAVVSLEPPHPPYAAAAAGAAPLDPDRVVLRANVPPEAAPRARRELAGYYAHVAATDRALGRLVAALPAATAVVATSLHGDMHGSHGLFRKGWPHEESVRVPLVVRARGFHGPQEGPASLLDLARLAAAWSDGGDGRGILGARPARLSMPSVVRLADQCDRAWAGVRTAARKLVLGPGGEPWLLFDLAADPLERRNLAADPDRADEIARLAAGV